MLLDLLGLIQYRKVGGDDAVHTGWNKKSWEKAQLRNKAIDATIEETYKRIMGIAPADEVVKEIKQEAQKKVIKVDYTEENKFIAWLTSEIESIKIAIRNEEEDEENALMLLLGV